jgi:glycosyltransferase involved in cell wall biosynthesis
MPFFTIITPTIQRMHLLDTCNSVNSQTCQDFEHLVIVDRAELNTTLLKTIKHPNRKIYQCDQEHKNYGHSCTHEGWTHATGEYVIRLDDDNILYDNNILEDIKNSVLEIHPKFALFPIFNEGHNFLVLPPGIDRTDSANMVVERTAAQWPNLPNYNADGIFADFLNKSHGYKAFEKFRPIIIRNGSNRGQ